MSSEPNSDVKPTRSRFKRILVRTFVGLAIVAVGLLTIRVTVTEEFQVQTDAVAPEIPQGPHLLVYKLTTVYHVGDIVLYRADGNNYVGRVTATLPQQRVTIARNGEPESELSISQLVGRCVWNTR